MKKTLTERLREAVEQIKDSLRSIRGAVMTIRGATKAILTAAAATTGIATLIWHEQAAEIFNFLKALITGG